MFNTIIHTDGFFNTVMVELSIKEKENFIDIIMDPGFLGAIVGAFLAGMVAVLILYRENFSKNKESSYRSYGTMKIISIQLELFEETGNLTNFEASLAKIHKTISKEKIINEGQVKEFNNSKEATVNLINTLMRERETIPYEFVTRFYTVIFELEKVVKNIDKAIEDSKNTNSKIADSRRIYESLIESIEKSQSINKEFRKNVRLYLDSIENKYKVKDYY